MLHSIDHFIGSSIMSLQTGTPLAVVQSAIIDPRKLKGVAFRVQGNRLSHQDSVLHPEDIREISDIGLIVDGDDALMPIEGLVRLKEVVDFDFSLDGLRVESEAGKLLGKIESYAVDPGSFLIHQLYTKPSFLRSIITTGLVVHRSQIASINNQRIVVKDPTISIKQVESEQKSNFMNPFRSPLPTPPEGNATHA